MITPSTALLFATLAVNAVTVLGAPIRIPVAREVTPPPVQQVGRRQPEPIAADTPLQARTDDPISRRFPRRVYYEYYGRHIASNDAVAPRAEEQPASKPVARAPTAPAPPALKKRLHRVRKRAPAPTPKKKKRSNKRSVSKRTTPIHKSMVKRVNDVRTGPSAPIKRTTSPKTKRNAKVKRTTKTKRSTKKKRTTTKTKRTVTKNVKRSAASQAKAVAARTVPIADDLERRHHRMKVAYKVIYEKRPCGHDGTYSPPVCTCSCCKGMTPVPPITFPPIVLPPGTGSNLPGGGYPAPPIPPAGGPTPPTPSSTDSAPASSSTPVPPPTVPGSTTGGMPPAGKLPPSPGSTVPGGTPPLPPQGGVIPPTGNTPSLPNTGSIPPSSGCSTCQPPPVAQVPDPSSSSSSSAPTPSATGTTNPAGKLPAGAPPGTGVPPAGSSSPPTGAKRQLSRRGYLSPLRTARRSSRSSRSI